MVVDSGDAEDSVDSSDDSVDSAVVLVSLRRVEPEVGVDSGDAEDSVDSSDDSVDSSVVLVSLRRMTFPLTPRSFASTATKSLERRAMTKTEEMKKRILLLLITNGDE